MIIWRSLYENSKILLLLAIENDPALADKFYRHSIRNSKNKIASYNTHYKELNFKPLSKSTNKKILEGTEDLINEQGKKFLDNDFGWADDLFPGKQKANFRFIENHVGMSRLGRIIYCAVNRCTPTLIALTGLWRPKNNTP